MIKDMRDYLSYLSSRGRILELEEEVDPELEITAFTDRVDRGKKYDSETLLFKRVKGSDVPVVTNLFGSMKTVEELFDNRILADILSGITSRGRRLPIVKGTKALLDASPKIAAGGLRGYEALPGLSALPILKLWPKDAGRFITLPLVITKSPKDGSTNVGIYRMQVFDDETTGMHFQAQKGGAIHASECFEAGTELKASVVIGTDPYNIMSGAAPLPTGLSEFAFSGVIRGSKTVLAKNGEYPEVPANSEIVLNGRIDPAERRIEGPFGDHTGYYSIPEPTYVFHVDGVLAKKDPIYAASVVGFPWHEDAVLGQFFVEYTKPMIRAMNESIADIYLPPEGLFTHMCFVSIKKRFPGEATKAAFSVLGTGQLSFIKIIAIFDEDVNIRDFGSVIWALSTRVEPQRDIQIINRATTDTLDHTANIAAFGSKAIIDATKKTKGEGYAREWPETLSMPEGILKEVDKKWSSLRH